LLLVAGAALAAVGVLVLMLLAVEARPAEATFPGKNGKIAFTGWDGHDREIYTIDPGGGHRVQLTHNKTRDLDPTFSPDGKKIAYMGKSPSGWMVYTINPTGGDRVKVAKGYSPSYSPDSKRIAYSGRHGKDFDIFTISTTGGGRVNLTNGRSIPKMKLPNGDIVQPSDGSPTYSPDGKKIAFMGATNFESAALFTVNVGGGGLRRFGRGGVGGVPDFSPDGKMLIICCVHGGMSMINPATGRPMRAFAKGFNFPVSSAAFSPDSKKLVYSGWDAKGKDDEIYTIPVVGGKPVQLTHNNTGEFSPSWGSR